MNFRYEFKHEINYSDIMTIRQRLKALCRPDPNADNGKYMVRNLYFDNLYDKILCEKVNGINYREKFRLRYYDNDISYIKLEKKGNYNGLRTKQSEILTVEETNSIINGDTDWMMESEYELIRELYLKTKSQGLKPKTIVEYTREPFVYPVGDVRITIDYDIRTGIMSTDFLDRDCVTIPVRNSPTILEVKWKEFLPSLIQDALQLDGRCAASFSKYSLCRIYG